jgi:hypothetical protein
MTGEHMAKGEQGRMLSPGRRSVLRLMLFTGQRRGEVAGAMKSELKFNGSDPMLPLLTSLTHGDGSSWHSFAVRCAATTPLVVGNAWVLLGVTVRP